MHVYHMCVCVCMCVYKYIQVSLLFVINCGTYLRKRDLSATALWTCQL